MELHEFIARYGEKGYLILKAILKASRRVHIKSLGDFSLRELKRVLGEMGIDYNPSPLLSKLEKEYNIIETTYRSSGQRWWRILNINIINDIIREYEGSQSEESSDDPRLRLLKVQFYSLEPRRILEILTRLAQRKKLTAHERNRLRKLAFQELPLLVDFIEKANAEYPDELEDEIALGEAILDLVESIVYDQNKSGIYDRFLEFPLRSSNRESF